MTKTDESRAADRLFSLKPIRIGLVIFAVLAQLATVLITWPLWQSRQWPEQTPNLPVFELNQLPHFSFGILIIFSLLVVVVAPRKGVWIHLFVLVVATLFDQMRIEPQFLANWFLLWAAASELGTRVTRWFLVSLWFWAGLHKLLSPDWHTHVSWATSQALGLKADSTYAAVAIVVALSELGLGLLAWFKPRWGAFACPFLHIGILIYLAIRKWNASVVPWNLAMIVIGSWVLWTAYAKTIKKADNTANGKLAKRDGIGMPNWTEKVVFALFMILPIGFYGSWIDRGYSHVLYSNNLPRGLVTKLDESVQEISAWDELSVPFPSERRLFRHYFSLTAKPGEKLHMLEPRIGLDDEYWVMTEQGRKLISKSQFLSGGQNVPRGYLRDSSRSIFYLSRAGVRLLKKDGKSMVFAVEFSPENFNIDLLKHFEGLQNVEEIQFRNTSIKDADLKMLKGLRKLAGLGLKDTQITDAGVKILQTIPTLKIVEFDGTLASDSAIEAFHSSRNAPIQ